MSKQQKPRPLYRSAPPKPKSAGGASVPASRTPKSSDASYGTVIGTAPFHLREDGTIAPDASSLSPREKAGTTKREALNTPGASDSWRARAAIETERGEFNKATSPQPSPPKGGEGDESPSSTLHPPSSPQLIFNSSTIRLYHGNSLDIMDAIAAKHPDGYFDMIFADPPYFLSNGGITCHAGKMVKVHKGDWDKSRGPELNHEFNTEWLRRCQRVLKPNGTIWVTGTHHVIFSVGYAMQQLGFKILNDIAWEKPNPPPNLSCRYFTHSTETILWAAKNEKSKHLFNYAAMRAVTGKQMKTVWRRGDFEGRAALPRRPDVWAAEHHSPTNEDLNPIWTMTAPGRDEKTHGKHPTQKPVALLERCLLASTHAGDMILDPFLGGGTTAITCIRLNRQCVGIEMDWAHLTLAARRTDREIVSIWLRNFRIRIEITVCGRAALPRRPDIWAEQQLRPTEQNDLALSQNLIDRSHPMADKPEIQTDRIYHETKFVFLSCAQVTEASVIHTTVDVSLQEAWAKTPNGKKRETTHIVRCETEILRLKSI